MKQLIAILTALLSTLYADATVYVGAGGIMGREIFEVKNPGLPVREKRAVLKGGELKVGYGDMRSYAVEMNVGYGYYNQNIYAGRGNTYSYADVSLIKAFDFDSGFYPFFKLGFGTGELDISRTLSNSMSSGSFFGGIGAYLPLGFGCDMELSVLYRDKSWEDLDMIGAQVESDSYLFEPYFGLNYRF